MKVLSGMLLLPLLFSTGSRGREKIDSRLLKKTRTLGVSEILLLFSKRVKGSYAGTIWEQGIKIKYELPLINAYAVKIEREIRGYRSQIL